MSAEKLPQWLPDGWIMKVRTTKTGRKHRYYTSPVSGRTFRSRSEVLHYLNIEKGADQASKNMLHSGDDEQHLVAQVQDSPEWLPSGWILEIKARMSGSRQGQKYKCYIDPSTGSRFYSKGEVFQYLKKGKCSSPPNHKKRFNTNPCDNVLSQFQYSPDGLPHGWIKEIKFRRTSNNKSRVRKDPYYTDPVSGYVFRSLRDAVHYVETGEVSKHTIRGAKRRISDMYSLEKESPPPISAKKLKSQGGAVRRCLFSVPDSNGEKVIEIDQSSEKPQKVSSVHFSLQAVEDADLICSTPLEVVQAGVKEKKGRRVSKLDIRKLPEPVEISAAKPKKGRRKISKPETSKSMCKKQPDSSNQIPLDPSDKQQLDLEDEKLPGLAAKKLTNLSKNKLENQGNKTDAVLSVGDPPEMESEKLLETVSKKHVMLEERLLEPENKFSLLEEHKSESACEKSDRRVKKGGSRTTKAHEALSLPRRASKRLAGIEADCVAELEISGCSHQAESTPSGTLEDTVAKGSKLCNQHDTVPAIDLEPLEKAESGDTLGEYATLGVQAGDGKPTVDWPNSPLTLPFGDSWPDPCIEFAFKTLTSDIPVLNDSLGVDDYFQQHLIPLQSSNLNGLASLSSDGVDTQAEPSAPMEHLDNHCSLIWEERKPGVLRSGSHSNGKVTEESHRNTRLKK